MGALKREEGERDIDGIRVITLKKKGKKNSKLFHGRKRKAYDCFIMVVDRGEGIMRGRG